MTGLSREDQTVEVQITGILEPIPHASHFHPQILLSWATYTAIFNFEERMRENWGKSEFQAERHLGTLFGLAAFTTRQRRKEIGIRKAVGASVLQIVRLLSTDFAALVGVAIVVCRWRTWGWIGGSTRLPTGSTWVWASLRSPAEVLCWWR